MFAKVSSCTVEEIPAIEQQTPECIRGAVSLESRCKLVLDALRLLVKSQPSAIRSQYMSHRHQVGKASFYMAVCLLEIRSVVFYVCSYVEVRVRLDADRQLFVWFAYCVMTSCIFICLMFFYLV